MTGFAALPRLLPHRMKKATASAAVKAKIHKNQRKITGGALSIITHEIAITFVASQCQYRHICTDKT